MSQRTTPGCSNGSPTGANEDHVTPLWWQQHITSIANYRAAEHYREVIEPAYGGDVPPSAAAAPMLPFERRRNSRWYEHTSGAIWHAFYLPTSGVTRWSYWPDGDVTQPAADREFAVGYQIRSTPTGCRRIASPVFGDHRKRN